MRILGKFCVKSQMYVSLTGCTYRDTYTLRAMHFTQTTQIETDTTCRPGQQIADDVRC